MHDEKKWITNEKGATSIFVIILMVVLFVFGLAALTTAMASLKLSQKNTRWSSEYYLLEAQAEKRLALIDTILSEVETSVIDSILLENTPHDYKSLYKKRVIEKIEEKSSDLNLQLITNAAQIYVQYNIRETEKEYPKNMTVLIEIILPEYQFEISNNEMIAIRQDEPLKRYRVIRFQEWQSQFEYEEDLDFSDPNFEQENNVDSNESPFINN